MSTAESNLQDQVLQSRLLGWMEPHLSGQPIEDLGSTSMFQKKNETCKIFKASRHFKYLQCLSLPSSTTLQSNSPSLVAAAPGSTVGRFGHLCAAGNRAPKKGLNKNQPRRRKDKMEVTQDQQTHTLKFRSSFAIRSQSQIETS